MSQSNIPGTVYLLHFARRYRHVQHYIGWTVNLNERLERHRSGHGARIIEVITSAGQIVPAVLTQSQREQQ